MESPDSDASPRAASETGSTNGANDAKDKKPFTYTPGGLDLSEIKSETMARRLLKNAMSPGVQEVPKQANRSGSLPSGPPLHSYNLVSVPVLPNVQLPANPKSLLRQTSGPNSITDPIDRILDSSIPFEITNGKKINGSITEGTPVVKNSNNKENEDYETKTINQTIRRNSEKLESSVEEVIEKLKQSLEEANKNLERVNIETNKKSNESFEEVSEEEIEEEEDDEQAGSDNEEEEDVIEEVTITRKIKTTTTNTSEQTKSTHENISAQQESKPEVAKVDAVDENCNIKEKRDETEDEEEIEEEEYEEEEEGEEIEEIETTKTVAPKTNLTANDEEMQSQVTKQQESEDEGNETDYSNTEEVADEIEGIEKDLKQSESSESFAKESIKSVQTAVEDSNVEKSDTGSNRSSKRNSVDENMKVKVTQEKEYIQEEKKQNETSEKIIEDTQTEHTIKVETVETVDITTTTKITDINEDVVSSSAGSQRPLSPQKRIIDGLGDIEKLPSLDISSKRFSFLRENEERQHEVYVNTPHNYPQSRQPRSTSPGYKISQYQAPAFERPIQKSYHPPPLSVVNKSFPPNPPYSQNYYQTQPNIQTQPQYPPPQTQYDYKQPISIQYYSPETTQYQTPQYNQSTQAQPQRAQEYPGYMQNEVIPPQNQSIGYPYYHETLLSQNQKQVEILPPWKTEETSNYGYENKSSFYGTSPIPKNEAPCKNAYTSPAALIHATKPISSSTTGVLNPLLTANKRHSWLQQTSIEQEVTDPLYEPEPVWKRELREMATKPNDYYTDEVEQKIEVEPPWRRELREYSQRNNPQPEEPKLEPQSLEPPWMKEVKYRLTTYNQPQAPPDWQTQTLRPKTWREKSVDLERMRAQEAPEWQKPNTINRPRPVSSYAKSHLEPNYLDPRVRGVSVDRERVPRPYQSPVNPINSTTSSFSNGYSLPWEVSSNDSPMLSPTPHQYDRTPTPQSSSSPYRPQQQQSYGYTPSATSSKREYATLSYQPRNRISNRTCPVQSRSFRYLQILTGTHDGYVDDEPFVAQSPLQGQMRPGHY